MGNGVPTYMKMVRVSALMQVMMVLLAREDHRRRKEVEKRRTFMVALGREERAFTTMPVEDKA